MADSPSFADWIARARAGDADAAADLVLRHERAVRVAVRVRLTDPRLRRQFDLMDVCQSVMASFFVRAAAGQFGLANPHQDGFDPDGWLAGRRIAWDDAGILIRPSCGRG